MDLSVPYDGMHDTLCSICAAGKCIEDLEKQEEKSAAIINQKTLKLKEENQKKGQTQEEMRTLDKDDSSSGEIPATEEQEKEGNNLLDGEQDNAEMHTSDEEQIIKEKTLSDEEILSNLNLLLVGDSVALGAMEEFYTVFPGSISDAAVNRQATESIGIYDSYINGYGWNGEGVIFALGSNGLLYDSLNMIRDMIGVDRPLFVFTIRAPYVSWEQSNNQEICAFVESAGNTYLIDWYKISEGHGEYFAGDGTHLTAEGMKAYVNGIKEAVLEVYKQ